MHAVGPALPRRNSKGRSDDDFNVMKWWLRSRDSVDDVQDRDIARSCSTKDGYRTEGEARAYATMNGMSSVLFTYQCTYCDRWHLTRRKT